MTESYYQAKLVRHFTARGWFVLNLIKTNKNGIPDLQLTHPRRPTIWIEVKTDIGVLSEIQKYRIAQLKERGEVVIVSAPKDYESTKQEVEKHANNGSARRPSVN